MTIKLLAAAAATAALAFAVPASATDVSFLKGKSGTQTVDGIKVSASAWWTITNASNSLPLPAVSLGRYDKGLGVTDLFDEGLGLLKNSHTIDNVNNYDFVALTFSQAVRLTGLTLNGFPVGNFKTSDTDAWISYGNGPITSLNPKDAQKLWDGYLARGSELPSENTFSNSSNFGKVWLIGASRTGRDRNDGFKLGGISFTTSAVPEPATWAMMIGGVGLVGGSMRRRRTATAKLAMA